MSKGAFWNVYVTDDGHVDSISADRTALFEFLRYQLNVDNRAMMEILRNLDIYGVSIISDDTHKKPIRYRIDYNKETKLYDIISEKWGKH